MEGCSDRFIVSNETRMKRSAYILETARINNLAAMLIGYEKHVSDLINVGGNFCNVNGQPELMERVGYAK